MTEPERDGILRMQDGVRDWVRRTARQGGQGLRTASPAILLSLLCASAVSPVVLTAAGITAGVGFAGAQLVSSIGGGVLSTMVSEVLDRLRERGKGEPSTEDLEEGIARRIQDVLSTAGEDARALRAEIATVLEAVDASGVALQASIEAGVMEIRRDIITVFGELSESFGEFRFLLDSIDATAVQILTNQDEQGLQLRVVLDRVGWAGTEARLAREEIAAWRNRPAEAADGPGRAADGPADQGPRWTGGSPYRGLLPFTEAEAGVFYGRERLTASLTGRLAQLPDRAGLMIVSGASGAGKSSLLRAGLLPALARGLHLPGSRHWPRIVMTPGPEPLAELAAHLAALGGGSAASVLAGLVADPDSAHLAVRQAVIADAHRAGGPVGGGDTARLVLVVDQFEQVFSSDVGGGDAGGSGGMGRQAFITALGAAATGAGPQGEPPALVILSVRGDYRDQCAAYPELDRALRDASFVVGPMTETELRLAITGPADAAGLRIEDTLTDTILSDLRAADRASDQGVLPLLSQAMLLTWENRDGDRLTARGYGQAGGVAGAVETSAGAVYDALPDGQRALAREVLTRMTAASGDGRITRRTVRRDDLYAGHPDTERDQIDAMLEAFAARRLVVLGDGSAEISHDALLQAWPRFRGWLEEDRASLILHTQLTEDAQAWRDHDDDRSFLYRGTQLAAVRQGAERWESDPARYPPLTGTERDFLQASDRAATRTARQRRIIAAALVLLLIASLTGAGIAINAANTARQQTALAVSSQLATQSEALDNSDPATAAQLAAASWHFDQANPLARESLLDVYAQPVHGILNADSKFGEDKVAFSPDGRSLAAADPNGAVWFWNVVTGKQVGASISVPGDDVYGEGYSPDSRFLATFGGDDTVRLWNAVTGKQADAPIPVPAGSSVDGAAFSRDGRFLATVDAGYTVRLWNAVTGKQVGAPISVPGGSGSGNGTGDGVAFSPDGRFLATFGGDDMVRLWNAVTDKQVGAPISVLSGGGSGSGVAFSPDGKFLATAGSDGMVRLWNAVTGKQAGAPISVPGGSISKGRGGGSGVAFSPDGKLLATAEGDDTVNLWDIAVYNQVGAPISVPGGNAGLVAFSPDGRFMAFVGSDGMVRLWNAVTGKQAGAPISVPGGGVNWAAFSRDGRFLATVDADGMVRLWNALTGKQVGATISVNSVGAVMVVFSRDDRFLTTFSIDDTVRLWNAVTGKEVGTAVSVSNVVNGVGFSLDGKFLATAASDVVQLWDVATGKPTGVPIAVPDSNSSKGVSDVAFSPDDGFLATVGGDGTVRLWDVATGHQIGAPISVPGGSVNRVLFSPDGKSLAINSDTADAPVRLWDVAFPRDLFGAVCAIGGGSLTRQQWNTYIPSQPYQKVCP